MSKLHNFIRGNVGKSIIIFRIIYLLSGAIFFHRVEGRRFFDSLYYAFVVMTTIGFGDFIPQTDFGKLLTMIYSFIGVPIFLVTSAWILQSFLKRHIQSYIYTMHKKIEAQEEHEEQKQASKHRWYQLFHPRADLPQDKDTSGSGEKTK